jgi:hypothetical protein
MSAPLTQNDARFGFNRRPLPLTDVASVALGGALVAIGPLLTHVGVRGVLAGLVAGAAFFFFSSLSLRYLSAWLLPSTLGGAVAGALTGLTYWILGRPDFTALGVVVLGAVGGAGISVFQLIAVQYLRQKARIEEQLDRRLTRIDHALSDRLAELDSQVGSVPRVPPPRGE